jgi:hypothetical protein
VKEIETALRIWEAMLYFHGLHQDGRPVPDNIVRMSELWDAVGWQAMRSHVREIVPFALDIRDAAFEDLEEGGFTFDFDFAPAFVETLLWSEDGAYREGESEEFLEDVMVAVRRRRQDIVARNKSSFDPASRQVDSWGEASPMSLFKTDALSTMQSGRLQAALDRHYRFHGVVKTLWSHIEDWPQRASWNLAKGTE